MSDYELLTIVLMTSGIIVSILIAYIIHTKSNRPSQGYGYFLFELLNFGLTVYQQYPSLCIHCSKFPRSCQTLRAFVAFEVKMILFIRLRRFNKYFIAARISLILDT